MNNHLKAALFLLSTLFLQQTATHAQTRQNQQQPYWQRTWDKGIAEYEMSRDYNAAVEHFTTVIEAVPRFWEAYFRRGLAFAKLLQVAEAIQDFRKAITLNPSLPSTFLKELNTYKLQDGTTFGLQGIFYTAARKYEEATSALKNCLEQKTLPTEIIFFCRGMVALETKQNIEIGCKDCMSAYNLGLIELATPLLKQYCSSKTLFDFVKPIISHQFIPRTFADSGVVTIAGNIAGNIPKKIPVIAPQKASVKESVKASTKASTKAFTKASTKEFTDITLEQSRDGIIQKRIQMPLVFKNINGEIRAAFSLQTTIKAELQHYAFRVILHSPESDTIIARADSVVCGDVYVCSGQSNMMLGDVPTSPYQDFMRTYLFDIEGKYWKKSIETNAISDIRHRIGGFAGELQQLLVEKYHIPICIINGAVGATSIQEHLYTRRLNTNLIQRVIHSGLQASVKAVFWYQGESNDNSGYFDNFTALTNQWKSAFPNLKTVYTAQIRSANCNPNADYAPLRETQRRFPAKISFVQTFATNAVPNYDGCHFNNAGYYALAHQVLPLVARDFYAATDTLNVAAPSVSKAFYSKADSTEITLEFSPTSTILSTPNSRTLDSTTYHLHEAFTADVFADGTILRNQPCFSGIRVSGNKAMLTLAKPLPIKSVSYANDTFYRSQPLPYDGPWLVNVRGVGALSFYRVPVLAP
jgi:Carbohydrate esterase, sialic acid-specific acetylesterase/Tetratricopeptide repeat